MTSFPEPPDAVRLHAALVILRVFLNKIRPPGRRFVERENGLDRARRHTGAAVDALVRMNIKHLGRGELGLVLPGVNAVHRADVHARGILRPDAWLADDVRHPLYDIAGLRPGADRSVRTAASRNRTLRGVHEFRGI